MRIFVTGAAGQVGSHVVDSAIARGDEVVGIEYPDANETANVPLVVIGLPLTDNPVGTVIATLVTVPNGFVAQDKEEPSVVKYFPLFPVCVGNAATKV